MYIIFDTETTGRTDFKKSYSDPVQPNLIQLGYQVVTADGMIIYETGHLVNSTTLAEWNGIEPGAYDVHKIDESSIKLYGKAYSDSLDEFLYWYNQCTCSIAHNHSFDSMIMQTFALRSKYNPDIFTKPQICTMKVSTPILKIQGPRGIKWPKLEEAYERLVDSKGFKGAHNALVDVNACREVFFALKNQELLPNVA